MTSSKTTRAIATGLLLVAFAVGWRILGPYQLGGTAAYVTTHGNSMEPGYREGDLVILRKAGGYSKGEIIGYESPSLDRTVLHRIHGEDGGGFITKGDNNTWLDSDRPKSADVIGKSWLHVPGAGRWLAKTRSPATAATLLSLVGLTFFLGNDRKSKRGRSKKGRGPQLPRIGVGSFTDRQKTWLAVPAGFFLAFLVLAVVGFRQPLISAVSTDAAFEHTGEFGYAAPVAKSAVYPTGRVEPGRPIFRRVVDKLNVRFDYRLSADVDHSISGQALMFARVSGATGWKKAVPVTEVRSFKGDSATLRGVLDLNAIQRLSTEVQAITGVSESAQKIELVPRITVEGSVGGAEIVETFSPSLRFDMDAFQLRVLSTEGAETTPGQPPESLRQSRPGEVTFSETEANDVKVLGMSFEIRNVRTTGLAGVVVSLLMLGFAWFRFSNPAHADEASLIEAQYGDWLIPVESMDRSGTKVVQIKSIESLVRLAELYERMILHDEHPDGHSYFVEEDGVVYCYRTRVERSSPPGQPSNTPRFSGRRSREERRRSQVAKLREELDEIEREVLKAGPSEE